MRGVGVIVLVVGLGVEDNWCEEQVMLAAVGPIANSSAKKSGTVRRCELTGGLDIISRS